MKKFYNGLLQKNQLLTAIERRHEVPTKQSILLTIVLDCFASLAMTKKVIYQLQFCMNKKRKGVSVILLIFSVIAILSLSGFVIDLGIILNSRFEIQKLVETTALTAITDYGAYEDATNTIQYPAVADISTNVNNSAAKNFDAFVASNSFLLLSRNITPVITFGTTAQSRYSRAIKVEATADVRTFFLNIIGLHSIKIQASAAAMHIPVYLKSGNVLNGTAAYKDTDLRNPAGGTVSTRTINGVNYATPSIVNINGITKISNIYGMPDATVVSLGPGGYITIKLPVALIDGKGFDLQILARGNAGGYFLFAGNDTDPASPYIDAVNQGSGISWVNISCTGTPVGTTTNGMVGSYNQNVGGAIGNQAKFYGSGYFDIGATCSNGYAGNVNSAKYLKIIDDNIEDGFILKNSRFNTNIAGIPSFFPGQNSSLTPGVSIDSIAVEHHSKLISINDFTEDTDNDGLLDIFEKSVGLNPSGSSDGPGTDDAIEFWGFKGGGISNVVIDNPTTALRLSYPTHDDDPPKMYISY